MLDDRIPPLGNPEEGPLHRAAGMGEFEEPRSPIDLPVTNVEQQIRTLAKLLPLLRAIRNKGRQTPDS